MKAVPVNVIYARVCFNKTNDGASFVKTNEWVNSVRKVLSIQCDVSSLYFSLLEMVDCFKCINSRKANSMIKFTSRFLNGTIFTL